MVININVPNIGENELEVTEIFIKNGDNIDINQPLLIIEGDKSSTEIPSPYAGIITKIHVQVGDKVQTGTLIISLDIIKTHDLDQSIQTKQNTKNEPNINNNIIDNNADIQKYHITSISNNNIPTHATPFIRHMARKFDINLSHIQGSGRKGRILKEDIQKYLSNTSTKTMDYNPINKNISSLHPDTNFSKFGHTETIQLNKIQKISASNLQKNWSIIPHVTQFDMVDITSLEIFRKQQNFEIKKNKLNYKITMLVFVIKAVSKALQELPQFNSSLSQDGHTLILKKYINIGIAVDTKRGLLVPVLQNTDKKNITTLSKELLEISQKARVGKHLTPLDIQGGTFTISNLGGIGGTLFTPIINAPEVAILGISQAIMKPVWTGKKFIPRLMLPLSLSYDHRVINGADGAKFINRINKIISDIRLLSI